MNSMIRQKGHQKMSSLRSENVQYVTGKEWRAITNFSRKYEVTGIKQKYWSVVDVSVDVESEELKSLLMNVKEESEIGLKLNIQKTKIMAYVPITSWQIYGITVEMVRDLFWGGSTVTEDGDWSHKIKRHLEGKLLPT